MIDEQTILKAERLRDGLTEFRKLLRKRYAKSTQQVSVDEFRQSAAKFAEAWLVELATDEDLLETINPRTLGDLNIHFQRILTFSEHATTRGKYDAEIEGILRDYSLTVVLPLKQMRGKPRLVARPVRSVEIEQSAFIGQSFLSEDKAVNQCVFDALQALGIRAVTGEKPRAEKVSDKVKGLIDGQDIFVGIFTRRDKISRKQEWTTSAWVIDEKAYALGRQKRLVLLKEQGVGSIGGIQGDYEYIEFSRDKLELLVIALIQLFDLKNNGLQN